MLKVVSTLALALAVACGSTAPARPGNAAVYERIAATSDCRELQREFDTADANGKRDREAGRTEQATWSTAYMKAADDRMRQVGCYK